MTNASKVEAFWQAYIDSLPEDSHLPKPTCSEVWSLGSHPHMANELGRLVEQGIKSATSSLVWEYQAENEPFPAVGEIGILTDGDGEPLCVVETTGVEIKPFNEVDEQMAYEEGEGDRSLEYWRKVHWEFFSEVCKSIGNEPSRTMPVLCERFRVLYRRCTVRQPLKAHT